MLNLFSRGRFGTKCNEMGKMENSINGNELKGNVKKHNFKEYVYCIWICQFCTLAFEPLPSAIIIIILN